ncbi:MAG: hypothetical protein M1812_003758 [Candelaria pacifica]|nr:MAG: hypothetical protein M1812_003758 [Candelaria pacifica]
MAPSLKRKRNDKWGETHLLTNPSSKLSEVNLFKVLGQPEAWNGLTQEEQASLLTLAPSSLAKYSDASSPARLNVEHPEFRHALHVFQGDLTAGRLDPKWLAKAADAMEERGRGEFDAYRREERILAFGEVLEDGHDDDAEDPEVQSPYEVRDDSNEAPYYRSRAGTISNPMLHEQESGMLGDDGVTDMRDDLDGQGLAGENFQMMQDTSIPPGAVEVRSKLKLEALVRGGCFQVGDVLLLRFKYFQRDEALVTKEATITGWDRNGYLSISYPSGLNLTSPAADGSPDLIAIRLTGPTHIATAMLTGDDGNRIGGRGSWKDFSVRRGTRSCGTLWDIRQAYHGTRQHIDRQAALPGMPATRHRRVPQRLSKLGYRYRNHVFEYVDPVTKEIMWADSSALDPDIPSPEEQHRAVKRRVTGASSSGDDAFNRSDTQI